MLYINRLTAYYYINKRLKSNKASVVMKISTAFVVTSAAIATVSAIPIRVISLDSLVGSTFEDHSGQDDHTRGKVWAPVGIASTRKVKADDNMEGWMDLINKYALGYTESRTSEETGIERPYRHWHHQMSEEEHKGDSHHRVALPALSSGRKPTIVHSPAEGMSDMDLKDFLIKAGLIQPSEAGAVTIKTRPNAYHGGPVREVVGGPGRIQANGYGSRIRDRRPAGQARCFIGRLVRAISAFKPHELFFFSFTFGMGLASLFRIIFMIFILIKRSHQYVNEVPASNEDAGYPGAEYRNRREEEREELLPAYEQVISEKTQVQSAPAESESHQA